MPAIATLLLSCLALALAAAPAHARPGQETVFDAPRELLSDDADLRATTLDELRAMGVDRLRVLVYWRNAAPAPDSGEVPAFDETDPAAYPGLGRHDRLLAEARARGLDVLLTVTGPVPKWATRARRDNVTRPSPTRFGRFMTALGRRYGDQVDTWAVWNEPNHPKFLRPQFSRGRAASPGMYRQLVREALRGLERAGQGRDRVLAGETAPRGTGRVVAPLAFARGALCLDSRFRKRKGCNRLAISGWAHHPYSTRVGPTFRPRQRDDVTIGVLSRLNRALHRAGTTGAVRKGLPIWITEFGVQSVPDPIVGVSESTQAEFLAISERIAWDNARVHAFAQYLMRDDDERKGARKADRFGGFESGLRTAAGKRKRAYSAFPLPLVARRAGRRPVRTSLWGTVRPASGATTVSIDMRGRGGRKWHFVKRVRTDRHGAWSTRSSYRDGRRWRVRWTAPDGTRFTGPAIRVRGR